MPAVAVGLLKVVVLAILVVLVMLVKLGLDVLELELGEEDEAVIVLAEGVAGVEEVVN
jgi:hypothetical protein